METRMLDNAAEAAEIILSGGLVAVPTETVYGLAANGLDPRAVEKIYAVKGRPENKPISLLVSGPEAIGRLCVNVPRAAAALAGEFWPGPLTMVLEAGEGIPAAVRAGGTSVGLRCPDHPLTLELIRRAGVPLAAPSANPSGEPSPKNAGQVKSYFNGRIDAIIDGGDCGIGFESTVLDMSAKPYKILRQGALEAEKIAGALRRELFLIGITGGTGCGKTTALKTLETMGALILDCDEIYHELTVSCLPMREEITRRFGAVYEGDILDRKKLGGVVFTDAQALAELNAITHKYVDMELERRLREFAMSGGQVAAIDAIGLLEAGFAQKTDINVAVTAPTGERIRRLMAREGISREYAAMRISAQHDNAYYVQNCGHVLENDGGLTAFEDKCNKFFSEVIKNGRE